PKLWDELASVNNHPSRRLRAAATLATISPQDASGWTTHGRQVVADAVDALRLNPADYDSLTRIFDPVAAHLRGPLADLAKTDESRSPESSKALDLLRVLGRDDPRLLVKTALALDAARLASTLALDFDARPDVYLPLLEQQLHPLEQQQTAPPRSGATSDELLQGFSRQATAAALLVRLGRADSVWPLLEIGGPPYDPTLRSLIIHRLAPLVTNPLVLVTQFAKEQDDGQRQAILLALGEFPTPVDEATRKVREPWESVLADVRRARDDAEAGAMVRGAAEWLLRTWNVERPPVELRDPKLSVQEVPTKHLRRFVGPERHEFVVLAGGPFRMGSPRDSEIGRDSDETAHNRRINEPLAMATKEVTIAQFRRFLEATFDKRHAASVWAPFADLGTDPTRPATRVSWYLAIQYCNWLSREAGLEPFYVPNPLDADAPDMQPNPGAAGLKTFRLPTEAEWEYAARAGTSTSYHFGDTAQLLEHYGWYLSNSNERTWPVGLKKPNDFGLFDMHGNVLEWCHDRYTARYPTQTGAEPVTDVLDPGPVQDSSTLARRGGAFGLYARHARSANRDQGKPTDAIEPVGFRVILVIPEGAK
ncbi:MAG: formylglycine-generating enzyme family protein, partial [Pirellulaceae bacterium]|nr:formylglycine-generating enzyme family protein [Pirellulaceae bacterium]